MGFTEVKLVVFLTGYTVAILTYYVTICQENYHNLFTNVWHGIMPLLLYQLIKSGSIDPSIKV